MRHRLRRADDGRRVGPIRVASAKQTLDAALRALAEAGRDRIAVTVSDLRPPARTAATGPLGLVDRAALEAALRRNLMGAEPALPQPQLSLVALDGLEQARERLSKMMMAEVMATIAAVLRAATIDGCTASELAPSRDAVLQAEKSHGAQMEQELRTLIAKTGRAGEVAIVRPTLPPVRPALGVRDLLLALSPARVLLAVTIGRSPVAHRSAQRWPARHHPPVDDVRSALRSLRFPILCQPVVRLPGRALHRDEALARFAEGEPTAERIRLPNRRAWSRTRSHRSAPCAPAWA